MTDTPMARKRLLLAVTAGAAIAVCPSAGAQAQACLGQPMSPAATVARLSFGLPHPGGDARLGEGVQTFGFDVRTRLRERAVVGAGYDVHRWDIDRHIQLGHEVHVLAAWEVVAPVEGAGLSVCAVTQPSYYTVSGEDDIGPLESTVFRVPLGVGAGYTHMLAPRISLTPFAVPQLVLGTGAVDPRDADRAADAERSDSFNSLGAVFGLTLGWDGVFLTASWSWHRVTMGDAEPAAEMGLRISAGASL